LAASAPVSKPPVSTAPRITIPSAEAAAGATAHVMVGLAQRAAAVSGVGGTAACLRVKRR
jgi:hypothetical protein